MTGWRGTLKYINLALLILYPIAWAAPLMRAGLLPLFSLSEISVLTGLQSLWASDVFLALVVTLFALFAPYLKTIGLALVHFDLLAGDDEPGTARIQAAALAVELGRLAGAFLGAEVQSRILGREEPQALWEA